MLLLNATSFFVDFFDVTGAKAWRIANKVLATIAEGLKTQIETFKITTDGSCLTSVSAVPGTATACVITITSVKTGLWIAWAVALLVSSLHVISLSLSNILLMERLYRHQNLRVLFMGPW